jgi:hypothetical protein
VPIAIAAACSSLLVFPLTAYDAPPLIAQWTLFLGALAVSVAAAWALSRRSEGLELEDAHWPGALKAVLVLGLLYFLLMNQYVFERNFVMPWFRENYPTLFAGVLAAIAIFLVSLRAEAPIVRALGWNVVLPWTFAVMFVAVAACTVCAFFPPGSLVLRALKNDVSTKARDLWLTSMIAVAVAFPIWSLLRLADRLATPLRYLAFVPFLLLCIVPLSEGKDLDAYIDRERRLSQQIMIDVSQATYGFWRDFASFEDPHRLAGPEELRLYARMKALIRSGRLTYKDEVVHIGRDHHLWVTTPFPAFTGVRQVFVLLDPQPYDFWTFEGRKYRFPDYFYQVKGVPKWILIEKKQVNVQDLFALKMRLVREFDGERFTLFSRP